jgi:hypothetical protein
MTDGSSHGSAPGIPGDLNSVEYELVFPEWYDDRVERECAVNGFFNGPTLVVGALQASLTVHTPASLAVDIRKEMPCAYPNLLVVPEITREAITSAVAGLHYWGFEDLAFEGRPSPPSRH